MPEPLDVCRNCGAMFAVNCSIPGCPAPGAARPIPPKLPSDRQRAAAHKLADKYGAPFDLVLANLDAFFAYSDRQINAAELQMKTGFVAFDMGHPTLF